VIDTGGIFSWLLGTIGIEGIFDRLKQRERLTDERGDPSFAASFVAVGGNSEVLGYFFEFWSLD
jgi:hypothetical protein